MPPYSGFTSRCHSLRKTHTFLPYLFLGGSVPCGMKNIVHPCQALQRWLRKTSPGQGEKICPGAFGGKWVRVPCTDILSVLGTQIQRDSIATLQQRITLTFQRDELKECPWAGEILSYLLNRKKTPLTPSMPDATCSFFPASTRNYTIYQCRKNTSSWDKSSDELQE